MATLQTSFLAATYGQDKVVLRDIMPYLRHRINPSTAVRAYHHVYRPRSQNEESRAQYEPKNPLDLHEQIAYGQYCVVYHMLHGCKTRRRILDYVYNKELGYPNMEITILEGGKKLQTSNGVWKEIQKGVKQGLLSITLQITKNEF